MVVDSLSYGAVYCPPSEFGESKDKKEKTNKKKSKSVDKKKND